MAKKVPVPALVRARVSEVYGQKLAVYAKKHGMTESAVIREALKKILRNVSIKGFTNGAARATE